MLLRPDPIRVLFHRRYRRFSGGHLKMWDYFRHVAALPGFEARVYFAPGSVLGDQNPWVAGGVVPENEWRPEQADLLFLGGNDWTAVPETCATRVVNLVQGVRHGDPSDKRFAFLSREAVRICVSEEVERAVVASGRARGPVLTIPNGVELPAIEDDRPRVDVAVAALKQPDLGSAVGKALEQSGLSVDVMKQQLPRGEYLARIRAARVAVLLPKETEGFYLPALEAMALETLVVCPDCIGNRSFCSADNCFQPSFEMRSIVAATLSAIGLSADAAEPRLAAGRSMAARHSLAKERESFHAILLDLSRELV